MVEPESGIAQVDDGGGIMGDEAEGATVAEFAHETHAFLGESGITDGEGFIDDEEIGIDVGDEGEGEAGMHA
ncbi:MAG: hypothetical protein WJ306_10000 [Ferrovum myxofaciens]